ncbi:ribonuclease J [Robertmurraya massiliosenegalensis]|uniref:ribonuclease J n=1 Tax=Robertmurraya massiliosenegalensis TaxID=1287657 RepID=UPI0002F85E1B
MTLNTRKNESIKITALGGVGEIGKNMYIVDVDGDLFVLDAGLMFPENEMLGIDIVIPDMTFLSQNKDRIKGIFLSHGHEDHIGALSYLLRQVQAPVYGMKLTIALAKAKMKEQEYKGKVNFIEIQSDTIVNFDTVTVSFFKTNHSIPDSVGIAIHTSEGAVVYTGDFKFDQAATELYKPEIGKMAALGEKGVLCLLSDSTDAEKPGYTPSESIIVRAMKDVFYNAKGRIIAASFASDLNRIQHIFDAAYDSRRKIVVVGKSLQQVFDIAIELDYLHVHHELIIPIDELKDYEDDEMVILATGMQGEPLEALQKMAKGQHRHVNVQKGDTVLIAASPLRGGEVFTYKTIDMLSRAGANVISGRRMVHTSSHGSEEELKFMINMMNPKYFVPVHGEYRMLKAHSKIAKECGITDDRIAMIDKGEVLEIKPEHVKITGKVAAGNVLVDGSGIGDVGNIVLRDRKLLSQDGVLIVVVTLNKAEKKISAGPEIISRGFVYVRESEELMGESVKLVKGIVEKNISREFFDWASIKQDMRDGLNQFLYEKTKRRPMIMPIIMEI